MEEIHATVCASHCGGTCLMKVHVQDGRVARIETDDGEEPQLRCCLRCRSYRQRLYAPDRLLYPLRRVGARGKGEFERISWEEAFHRVAAELKRVKETYGSSAIMLKTGGGDLTLIHGMGRIMERLLNLFGGFTGTWGSNSWEAATFASIVTYGTISVANTRDDLLNSRLILMWGWNPSDTIQSTNTTFYVAQAKEKGCKIISVDPKYTDTTGMFADEWIPIRPSTDTAMLIAMAYVMVQEGLYDKTFVDRYTLGFEQYKNYLLGAEDRVLKTPAWAEEITGVPAATIAVHAPFQYSITCTWPAPTLAVLMSYPIAPNCTSAPSRCPSLFVTVSRAKSSAPASWASTVSSVNTVPTLVH